MDAVTCYDEMTIALCEGDRQTVGDRAESLVQWIERGGCVPPALLALCLMD